MNKISTVPRCVVTGHKNGIATIVQDGPVKNVITHPAGFVVSDVWATSGMPIDLQKSAKIEDSFMPLLQQHGTLFRQVVIPPDDEVYKHFPLAPGAPHPLMHKTATLDYIIILSGEVYLIMEDTETKLQAGDIVIQCATNHAWSNRLTTPCFQLAILLDAQTIKNSE